ncbi:MAG: hypothetical protein JWM69_1250, partial [Candidatus Binatus sp.]|nr:hypothetical protein [Candidatus Binatus sp.]
MPAPFCAWMWLEEQITALTHLVA